MYAEGGRAYVYLCYGIHHLFNIVTNVEGIPHAVLVRGIIPEAGIDIMKLRRNSEKLKNLAAGPGTVSQALGIKTAHSGIHLGGDTIWLEESNIKVPDAAVRITPRIGVDYAGEDAKLPYRFLWKDNS
jgi:DNA-3-methyladenine glycosylase